VSGFSDSVRFFSDVTRAKARSKSNHAEDRVHVLAALGGEIAVAPGVGFVGLIEAYFS